MSYVEPMALRQLELEQAASAAAVDACDLRPRAEAQFIERLKRGDAAAPYALMSRHFTRY